MTAVWFTSDTHFRHERVAALRGFQSIEEHDETIIDNWNSVVGKDDHVWLLGDVGMGSPREFFPLVERLRGTKHLVAGNHDQVWPGNRGAHRHHRSWLGAFASIQTVARRKIGRRDVLLTHLPYYGDHTDIDRFTEYRLRDNGLPLLCGHVHQAWRTHATTLGTPQVNVGVDQWDMTPITVDQISGLIHGSA